MISSTSQLIEVQEKSFIRKAIQDALTQRFPFSLWKTPDQNEKHLIISQGGLSYADEVNLEVLPPGFVFAPFLPEKQKIIFPADILYRFENGLLKEASNQEAFNFKDVEPKSLVPFNIQKTDHADHPDFRNLVKLSLEKIELGEFEKIVPSRIKDISIDKGFDLLNAFELLCLKNPHALVSMVSSPETGTWMGATPELLVSVAGNKFKTVALAGTLPYTPDMNLKSVAWTQKEIEEQALVCRYIISCFKKIRLREYDEHGPKTTVAGNVMHLKTDYEVDMHATNFPQLGSVMLKLLHPTSAVCGMPLESSAAFLKEYEGYDRQFYSGYLGPVNIKKESQVFVNLRCMQLFSDKIRLYAGAGVTADSIVEMEWNETEMKMANLQKIINQ
jgi:isochorismate synthase